MNIGILKEIKSEENRVCMTPAGVEVMRANGHTVVVEKTAGAASGYDDRAYTDSGAELAATPKEIYDRCEMVMHVKAPLASEVEWIRPGQIVFSYLHLAATETLTRAMIDSGCIGIAYETVRKADQSLPLLIPMSEVAGRMAIQQGARFLEVHQGGQGILLGGVPGVPPAMVVVIGGGVVGANAAKMACGLGARVYVLDIDLERLRYLSDVMPANCFPVMSGQKVIRELLEQADLVVGAVLVAGAKTPRLVTNAMIGAMKKGAVLVDVAVDQGGCFECSRPTTHAQPTFKQDGALVYAVPNMPGAVPRTSTLALTNATLPYALQIANRGWQQATKKNAAIKSGLNIVNGQVTCRGIADAFDMAYVDPDTLL